MRHGIWFWLNKRIVRPLRTVLNLWRVAAAIVWRRLMTGPTVIAVTGSVGKTTCKDFLASILSQMGPTLATVSSGNGRWDLPRVLLRLRPRHRFLVIEVGIMKPGHMWRSTLLVRPDMTVILSVGRQHTAFFDSIETTAREKAKLLDRLPAGAPVVLNADDPLVRPMAEGRDVRAVMFGRAPKADVRGEPEPTIWPDRFAFNLTYQGRTVRVRTRFPGGHWIDAVLGAAAAALAVGATLEQCVSGIESVEPHPGRMQPMRLPSGAVMVCDEWNGAYDCYLAALEFFKQARAKRKIAVLGVVRDADDRAGDASEWLGRSFAAVADLCLFHGKEGARSRQAAIDAGASPETVLCFDTQKEVAERLRGEHRAGDLILLKGHWWEHLSRIYYRQVGETDCTLDYCEVGKGCERCPSLRFRPAPDGGVVPDVPLWAAQESTQP